MDRTEAIEHLKVVLKTCDVQDEEAVEMAIKALEETHTLNGSTLTIKVSEEDIDKVKRIMLDYAPWCKVFYEDDKDINVHSKWIPVSERLPKCEQEVPIKWIEAYADWLTEIPAPFAANDEKSIRAMLTKWKTNPELQKIGCNKDYCDL